MGRRLTSSPPMKVPMRTAMTPTTFVTAAMSTFEKPSMR